MRSIIIYESPYGSVEEYAEYLAKGMQIEAKDLEQMNEAEIENYDLIILGTDLISGKVYRADVYDRWIRSHPDKFWVMFTVGLSTPELTDFDRIMGRHFTKRSRRIMTSFHFRGRIATKRFLIMYLASKRMRHQPGTSLDDVIFGDEEWELLKKHGTTVERADLIQSQAIVEYTRTLEAYEF